MEHKTIETSRGTLSYWIDGNRIRPRLLLLHGALMDHRMFFHQATFFRDNFLLIMPDLPAHGRSRPYKDFAFTHTVEDLLDILDQEKVRHTHI
jgi:pimeloyl-ACP methyl ester carboxylesterase